MSIDKIDWAAEKEQPFRPNIPEDIQILNRSIADAIASGEPDYVAFAYPCDVGSLGVDKHIIPEALKVSGLSEETQAEVLKELSQYLNTPEN